MLNLYPPPSRKHLRLVLCIAGLSTALLCLPLARAAEAAPQNLALQAQATAFEEYQGMRAGLATDGNMETRWSGIPGHNLGGWFELDWTHPVRVGEVVVFQYDRYVKEMDVQVWDSTNQVWVTLQHLGNPDRRLPKIVVCRFPSRLTTRVRLANITNGPSFTEVQVFEEAYSQPPAVVLASDADGHFIGMVSDAWGSDPLAGNEVTLAGHRAERRPRAVLCPHAAGPRRRNHHPRPHSPAGRGHRDATAIGRGDVPVWSDPRESAAHKL